MPGDLRAEVERIASEWSREAEGLPEDDCCARTIRHFVRDLVAATMSPGECWCQPGDPPAVCPIHAARASSPAPESADDDLVVCGARHGEAVCDLEPHAAGPHRGWGMSRRVEWTDPPAAPAPRPPARKHPHTTHDTDEATGVCRRCGVQGVVRGEWWLYDAICWPPAPAPRPEETREADHDR